MTSDPNAALFNMLFAVIATMEGGNADDADDLAAEFRSTPLPSSPGEAHIQVQHMRQAVRANAAKRTRDA